MVTDREDPCLKVVLSALRKLHDCVNVQGSGLQTTASLVSPLHGFFKVQRHICDGQR